MRMHRRPRERSNPSLLRVSELHCRASLSAGGSVCSRGHRGIPFPDSDLVTMNVLVAQSDSFFDVERKDAFRKPLLHFLIKYCTMRRQQKKDIPLIQRGGGIGPLKPQQPPGFPGRC